MSWGILLICTIPGIVVGIPLFVVYSQPGIRGGPQWTHSRPP